MKTFATRSLLVAMTLGLMACGGGFSNSSGESSLTDNNGGLGQTPSPVETQNKWQKVQDDVQGSPTQDSEAGNFLIKIDVARQSLILIVPMPAFLLSPTAPIFAIPQMPGATVEYVTQEDGTQALGVVVPLKYIMKGSSFGQYASLPDGRPLPYMPSGEQRGFVIDLPQKKNYRLHFYMTVNAAAAFIEVPDFKFPEEVSWIPMPGIPIMNQARTQQIGYVQLIPNHGAYATGVYVASRIPTPAAILINQLLQY